MDGLLLAGGKSKRMGSHKGSLLFGKETFTERLIGELKKVSDKTFISYGETSYEECDGAKVIMDDELGLGPIEGVIKGLKTTNSDRLIVAACDMPYIKAEFFTYLNDKLDKDEDAICVIPVVDGKMNPLAAIYKKEALSFFEESVKNNDYSLKGAINKMPAAFVCVEEKYRNYLKNVNTKEEYRCLLKMVGENVEVDLDFAENTLINSVSRVNETEEIPLFDASGRVLASDKCAMFDNPPFNRSPLDGYAIRGEDTLGATKTNPVSLKVIYEVTAGDKTREKLKEGEAVRIMTGGKIPEGANAIIRQEDTDFGEREVLIFKEHKPYDNFCYKGEDFKKGDVLIKEGSKLTPQNIGIIASTGSEKVKVYRKIKAGIITTGDEIRKCGKSLEEGQIYNSNLYTITSVMEKQGYDVVYKEAMGDNAEDIAEKIKNQIEDVDVFVTTGGVSVGKKDIMHDVFSILDCKRLFWRIRIKPGMPTLAGLYKDKLIVSLSGNPYGAFVNAHLLLDPVYAVLSGKNNIERIKVKAKCMGDYPKRSGTLRYLRGSYIDGKVYPIKGSNDSGVLSTAANSNALIQIEPGTDKLQAGDMVWAILI